MFGSNCFGRRQFSSVLTQGLDVANSLKKAMIAHAVPMPNDPPEA